MWPALAGEDKEAERQEEPARQTEFSVSGYETPAPAPQVQPGIAFKDPFEGAGKESGAATEEGLADTLQAPDTELPGAGTPTAKRQPRASGSGTETREAAGFQTPPHEAAPLNPPAAPAPAPVALPEIAAAPITDAAKPDKHDARRAAEAKSSAPSAATGSSSREARPAPRAGEPSAAPEPADSGSAHPVRSQLAFTGRLAPVAADTDADAPAPSVSAPPQRPAPEMNAGAGDSGNPANSGEPDAAAAAAAPAVADAESSPAETGAAPNRGSGPAVATRAHEATSPSGSAAPETVPTAAGVATSAQRAGSAAPVTAAARLAAVPEPAPSQKVAHDITLELDSGSQRAAVRLVERGGEIHIAVRTPDAGLAADLRQGLPSLAAKLEQTGYRTETWHPGAALRHEQGFAAGSTARDGSGPSGQSGQESSRERREGQPQPRETGSRPQPKKEGKDFAWFMSSLG